MQITGENQMKILLEKGEEKPKCCADCDTEKLGCWLWTKVSNRSKNIHPECPMVTEQEYVKQLVVVLPSEATVYIAGHERASERSNARSVYLNGWMHCYKWIVSKL